MAGSSPPPGFDYFQCIYMYMYIYIYINTERKACINMNAKLREIKQRNKETNKQPKKKNGEGLGQGYYNPLQCNMHSVVVTNSRNMLEC